MEAMAELTVAFAGNGTPTEDLLDKLDEADQRVEDAHSLALQFPELWIDRPDIDPPAAGHLRLARPIVAYEFLAYGLRVRDPLIGLIELVEKILRRSTISGEGYG